MTKKMRIPKISTGEFVEVIFTDLGDARAIYDGNGNPHEGYTSKFEWDEVVVKNYVYREIVKLWEVEKLCSLAKFRYNLDCDFLEKYDLDLGRAVFE